MSPSPTPLQKRLAAYAAAAGITLAIAPDAGAQVQYVDINPDVVLNVGDPDYLLDLDVDGSDDLHFWNNAGGVGPYATVYFQNFGTQTANVFSGYDQTAPPFFRMALALSSGDPINGSNGVPIFAGLGDVVSGYGTIGQFPGAGDKYLGLRFTADAAGAATQHYAWVRIEMAADVSTYTIKDYAWEIAPDTPIDAATVPVEFVSFDAQVNGDNVVLNWETASETNNAGFEVQMKQGEDWQALGFVEGHGTTTEAQTYSYTAGGMDVGTHTFRLKQIDFDGAFEYSDEVEATIEVVGTHQLSNAYPNPFNPTSQFTLAVSTNQQVKAELYNVLGRRVATLFDGSVDANASQIVQIDGSALASGAYIVRVVGETFADALRVTLTK